jgi:hypothetical protein
VQPHGRPVASWRSVSCDLPSGAGRRRAGWWQTVRMTGDDVGGDAAGPRPVIGGAFGLLASLHRLGSARVSQLQRDSGLPRTTVHRLLTQLEEVGAVERSAGRWRLGPTPVEYGAGSRPSHDCDRLSGAPPSRTRTAGAGCSMPGLGRRRPTALRRAGSR